MADALSRKNHRNLAMLITLQQSIIKDMIRMEIRVRKHNFEALLANFRIQPTWIERIKVTQLNDPVLQKIQANLEVDATSSFKIHDYGSLRFNDRLYVPDNPELKKEILDEAHYSGYTMHPGGTKMYRDLRDMYWWNNMKREIATFVAQYLVYQQVRLNIEGQQVNYNHSQYQNGSGSTLP